MDPNSRKAIEDFVTSMQEVARLIKQRNPDVIVAPMFGAVPFIDVLGVIDDAFPNEKVVYVPASNRVYRLREVLRGTFQNVIREHIPLGGSLLSLDEVVSGNSLMRVYKQFEAARVAYANEATVTTFGPDVDFRLPAVKEYRDALITSINYRSIGVVDSKLQRQGRQQNPEYQRLVDSHIVIPVQTPCIVTMDRPEFFPARYKEQKDSEGRTVYLPVVEQFQVSQPYIDLLITVADMMGKDRNVVTMHNLARIRNSYQYVPEHLRHL